MIRRLLTFLVCAILTLPALQHSEGQSRQLKFSAHAPVKETRLWCGLIDPELSRWLARIPMEGKTPLFWQWDWSWHGFLTSLFSSTQMTEEQTDAPIV